LAWLLQHFKSIFIQIDSTKSIKQMYPKISALVDSKQRLHFPPTFV
jgi:hypothetical protein